MDRLYSTMTMHGMKSPAGVGFSYSNTTSDSLKIGDKRTTEDSYAFVIHWLERFPQYKTRDFFITGESYAGRYVPQLAHIILSRNNNNTNQTIFNLKGIAMGNAWIDDNTNTKGMYDFYWTHALNSDETHVGIDKYCDYITGNYSDTCNQYQNQGDYEYGNIDIYNTYAPHFSIHQEANLVPLVLSFGWIDRPTTILPTIKQIMASGIINTLLTQTKALEAGEELGHFTGGTLNALKSYKE
ncbi:unnamed protein product [Ilex paraguariensis]|uniref:Carboxypeptidase n=1 Tax=Ilex paraguariensis TaxID=185542 RepID=A0ABC8UAC3_9AQUA